MSPLDVDTLLETLRAAEQQGQRLSLVLGPEAREALEARPELYERLKPYMLQDRTWVESAATTALDLPPIAATSIPWPAEAKIAEAIRSSILDGTCYLPGPSTPDKGTRHEQLREEIKYAKERGLPLPQGTRVPLSDKDKKARKKARKRRKRGRRK